jgi:adenylyltransferase/sulfurtransferase
MTTKPNDIQLSHEEIRRYSRHLIMPEVGMPGQKKLKAASVLLVGMGGLGSPAAMYLAAAGIGRIGLIDYDTVAESNLQRQIIHGKSTVGDLKVDSAKKRLLDLNPDVQVDVYNVPFTSANALEIAAPYDVIIDGTDNFPTRYLVNDVSVKLGKVNVYGSIFRFDGQVTVFDAEHGPCYRCLFPEPPPPGLVPSCAEGGVLGILPGTIGTLQATEALKAILGIGDSLVGKLMLYNALDFSFDFVNLRKNPNCVVCSKPSDEIELIDYEQFCGMPMDDHIEEGTAGDAWDISALDLRDMLNAREDVRVIDVRDPHEWDIVHIDGATLIPLPDILDRMNELDTAESYVMLCRSGVRSAKALHQLREAGFHKLKNLRGGILAWAQDVDPSLPQY